MIAPGERNHKKPHMHANTYSSGFLSSHTLSLLYFLFSLKSADFRNL
jgi:hypothetical protein